MTTLALTNWMPVLLAMLSLCGAVLTYAYQRKLDRQASLIELRRDLYRDFIISMMDVSESDNGETELMTYRRKLVEVHLFGSDEVIRAAAEFTDLYRRNGYSSSDRAEKFAALQVAMRRDCYESTDIGANELRTMLPLNF